MLGVRNVGYGANRAGSYSLNISRYISTAKQEQEIDLKAMHAELLALEQQIKEAAEKHHRIPQKTWIAAIALNFDGRSQTEGPKRRQGCWRSSMAVTSRFGRKARGRTL
jgi:hypothetical protein